MSTARNDPLARFVHHSALKSSGFKADDKVEYDAEQGQKGPQAGNVRPA